MTGSCEPPGAAAAARLGWAGPSRERSGHGREWFLPVPPSGAQTSGPRGAGGGSAGPDGPELRVRALRLRLRPSLFEFAARDPDVRSEFSIRIFFFALGLSPNTRRSRGGRSGPAGGAAEEGDSRPTDSCSGLSRQGEGLAGPEGSAGLQPDG